VFSLAPRSMGRRCSKKAVRCRAIDVLVLASASGDFSLPTRDGALRRGFLAVPWHPLGQAICALTWVQQKMQTPC